MAKVDVYREVTDAIIAKLEAGTAPWQRPWSGTGVVPGNLLSQKPYSGINPFLLALQPYSSPWWLTYKQALSLGGFVRKGEKGTKIIFWKIIEKKGKKPGDAPENVPLARYYTVFNIEQCDGIKLSRKATHPERTIAPIEACEKILAELPATSAKIVENGSGASYSPSEDVIRIPQAERFHSPEERYATLFHELVHSTGHKSRLHRFDAFRSDNHAYSREELVAELGAAFLAAEAGIAPAVLDNSAAYLNHWIKELKGDPRLIISVGSAAQKAVNLLRGRVKATEEVPDNPAEVETETAQAA